MRTKTVDVGSEREGAHVERLNCCSVSPIIILEGKEQNSGDGVQVEIRNVSVIRSSSRVEGWSPNCTKNRN